MFTWICPQCGREVPPSYTECPDCAAKAKGGAAAVSEAPTAEMPTAAPAQSQPVQAYTATPEQVKVRP